MADNKQDNRDFRRVKEDRVEEVTHKSVIITSPVLYTKGRATNYQKRMRSHTLNLNRQLLTQKDRESLIKTQNDARTTFQDAQQQIDEIDELLADMAATKYSPATESLPPNTVKNAFTTALGYYRRPNGYYSEMRRRDKGKSADGFNPPIYKSSSIVRANAVDHLTKLAFAVETQGFDEKASFETQYKDIPILSDDPKETKNIAILLPQAEGDLERDVAQFHHAIMLILPESERPDSIALAKTYLKFRRSIWNQTRPSIV